MSSTAAVAFVGPGVVQSRVDFAQRAHKTDQLVSVVSTFMGQLTILYWRDIPSQVIVKAGRANEKRMLSSRFQEAIDMAAMRDGAQGTDDYLSEWRRADAVPCGDDVVSEADRIAAELESRFDKAALKALIDNGGRKPPVS